MSDIEVLTEKLERIKQALLKAVEVLDNLSQNSELIYNNQLNIIESQKAIMEFLEKGSATGENSSVGCRIDQPSQEDLTEALITDSKPAVEEKIIIEYEDRTYSRFKPCKYKCGLWTSFADDYKKGDRPIHINPMTKEVLGGCPKYESG